MKSLIAVFAFVLCGVANAAFYDASKLQSRLNAIDRVESGKFTDSDALDVAYGVGYVAAVVDGAVEDKSVCLPPRTSLEQIVAIARKFMRDNPAIWNMSASTVVITSLVITFPCKK